MLYGIIPPNFFCVPPIVSLVVKKFFRKLYRCGFESRESQLRLNFFLIKPYIEHLAVYQKMAQYFDMEAGGGGDDNEEEGLVFNGGTHAGKHYDYCFTLNNYVNPDDTAFISNFATQCTYLVYQYERGENGTPHFQGYFRFKSRRSFAAVRRLLTQGGRCRFHLEPRRGTIDQAIQYCTDITKRDVNAFGDIVEHGIRPAGGGSRTDIRDCLGLVKQGKKLRDLYDQHPEVMVKYARGISAARIIYEDPRNFKTIVKWYYGGTGTGKSRAACDEAGDDVYWKAGGNKWWDGYDGQETVIIDDYRCDLCPFHVLLRLFDRYPMQVEGKGTVMQFRSRTIIVTAPHKPQVMWRSRVQEDLGQLLRRIEEIKLFGDEPIEPEVENNRQFIR